MYNFIDYTGCKIGHLTVIKRIEDVRLKNGRFSAVNWLCKCDCGNYTTKRSVCFTRRRNTPLNCGCIKRKNKPKHGLSGTKIYYKWNDIHARCNNENRPEYKNYGGRGIKVCPEWCGENGFENFLQWALLNGWDESDSKNMTIDRIDVDGDYCPENCRFVDMKIQGNNKRNNIVLSCNGEAMTLSQWCEKYNLNYKMVYERYRKGFSVEDCLFAPWYSRIKKKGGANNEYS